MSWVERQIGDFAEIKHGFPFDGQYFADNGDFVVLTPGNCHENGGFRDKGEKEKFYAGPVPEGYLLSEGDLLVVMTDLISRAPVLGGSFFVPANDRYLHNQRLGLVQVTEHTEINRSFLFYLFNTHGYRGQIRGSASGATVRHTSPNRIKSCKVRIPSEVREQAAIAGILSAYDDLIENNRRRIALLEEAARLLYREWFVYLRFPGHEHVKIIDGIPQGWKSSTLGSCATFESGGTPSKSRSEYWTGDIPWVSSGELTRMRVAEATHNVTEAAVEAGSRYADPDTILAVVRGMSLAKEFRLGIVTRRVCFNQDLKAIVPNRGVEGLYLFHMLDEQRDRIRRMAGEASHGTKKLETAVLQSLPVTVPPSSIRRHFLDYVQPLHSLWDLLFQQKGKLEAARDLLLPRLMNGEIAV